MEPRTKFSYSLRTKRKRKKTEFANFNDPQIQKTSHLI